MPKNKYNYEVPGDKWWDWKGVKRPERQPNMTEEEKNLYKETIEKLDQNEE